MMQEEQKELDCLGLLQDVISLAKLVESRGFLRDRWQKAPLALISYQMLIQARRLSESIKKLGTEHAHEASILARSLLELWVNGLWLRIEDSTDRALRFLQYEGAERLNLLRKVPEAYQDDAWHSKRQHAEEYQKALKELAPVDFHQKKTWAIAQRDGEWVELRKIEDRFWDVSKHLEKVEGDVETGSQKSTRLYVFYSVWSHPGHGSPLGLAELLSGNARYFMPKVQPSRMPIHPLKVAIYHLLSILEWSEGEFSRSQEAEFRRLANRTKQLFPSRA